MSWLPWSSARAVARAIASPAAPPSDAIAPVATAERSQLSRRRPPGRMRRSLDPAWKERINSLWAKNPTPITAKISRTQRAAVARCRERGEDSDYGARFLQLLTENVVGPQGVRLKSQVTAGDTVDTDATTAVEAAWRAWGKRGHCDVTGTLSLRTIQTLCLLSAATDGEFFVRLHTAGAYGLQLQVLDAQRCPVDYDDDSLPDGRYIRHGIEFTALGKPLAYYFHAPPSAATHSYSTGLPLSRVPADEIVHGFVVRAAGQTRGMPWLTSTVERMKGLSEFEAAAVVNARIAASRAGFIQYHAEFGGGPIRDEDAEPYEVELEPGVYQELPVGATVSDTSPTFPAGEFAEFSRSQLRAIAAGLGISYHTLAQDLGGVSYSSARTAELADRAHYRILQGWLAEELLDRVYDRWLEHALLSSQISIKGRPMNATAYDRLRPAEWQGRGWTWVDPKNDVSANIISKNNGLASPSQIIEEGGRDPEVVWREIARDRAAMIKAGIPEYAADAMIFDAGRKNVAQGNTTDGDPNE